MLDALSLLLLLLIPLAVGVFYLLWASGRSSTLYRPQESSTAGPRTAAGAKVASPRGPVRASGGGGARASARTVSPARARSPAAGPPYSGRGGAGTTSALPSRQSLRQRAARAGSESEGGGAAVGGPPPVQLAHPPAPRPSFDGCWADGAGGGAGDEGSGELLLGGLDDGELLRSHGGDGEFSELSAQDRFVQEILSALKDADDADPAEGGGAGGLDAGPLQEWGGAPNVVGDFVDVPCGGEDLFAAAAVDDSPPAAALLAPLSPIVVRTGVLVDVEPQVRRLEALRGLEDAASAARRRDTLAQLLSALNACRAPEFRGFNKVAEYSNSIMKHDGLPWINELTSSRDAGAAGIASELMSQLIPMIWSA
jgi:hypothetical protein